MLWPQADMFRLHRGDLPAAPVQIFHRGTRLFHGTRSGFGGMADMSWYTLSPVDAAYYAQSEAIGSGPPLVLTVLLRSKVRLLSFPSVTDREEYQNAIYWAKAIFGETFDGIGYKRMPKVFKAVCSLGLGGIYIAREDSGKPSIMLCHGRDASIVDRIEISR